MHKTIRRLVAFPVTLFGAVSLTVYLINALTASPAGPVLRALMMPAYVVNLAVTAMLGGVLRPLGLLGTWVVILPLHFLPFVPLDLALARASRTGEEVGGRGTV